jgi:uncharacterized membrane protein
MATLYDFVLALHVLAVVIAFGWTFALPLMFVVASRHAPRSLPVLHRIEYTGMRFMLNPALLVIVAAGAFLAGEGHHWSEFFVQWGFAAVVVIGAVAGSVMIPTAKRAEQAALADLAAAGDGEPEQSDAYKREIKRLNAFGGLLWAIVVASIVIMAVKP